MSANEDPEDLPDSDPTREDATARLAARIARRASEAHPGLPVDALLADELPGNELTTLLLHAMRRRAFRRSFQDVREHSERLAMTHASSVDPRRLHAFDGTAFEAARAFEPVELAPVAPLGTAACVGVDPNNVLATLRFAEVAADPATGLALHAARLRRKARAMEPLRVCTSQRVLRTQPWDRPGYTPHFRLFALATFTRAERSADDDACDRRALLEQLLVWLDLFERLPAVGFAPVRARVVLSDTRVVRAALRARGLDAAALARRAAVNRPDATRTLLEEAGVDLPREAPDGVQAAAALGLPAREQSLVRSLVDEVAAPLGRRAVPVNVSFDFARLQGLSYYRGPFIQLHVRRNDGFELPIGDGGALGWMGALLGNRRERMVATGVGAELVVKLFDAGRSV